MGVSAIPHPPPTQSSASSMMGGESSSGEKQGFLGGVPPLAWFACPARGGCCWGNATFRGVLPYQEGRPLALNNGTGPAWPCAARRGGGIAPAARRASCCPPPPPRRTHRVGTPPSRPEGGGIAPGGGAARAAPPPAGEGSSPRWGGGGDLRRSARTGVPGWGRGGTPSSSPPLARREGSAVRVPLPWERTEKIASL